MGSSNKELNMNDILSLIFRFLVKHDLNKTAKRLLKECKENLLEPVT